MCSLLANAWGEGCFSSFSDGVQYMPIRVAVPKERFPGEKRVALVPETVARVVKLGFEVKVEQGAGAGAYYADEAYEAAGAALIEGAAALYEQADIVCKVQPPDENEVALFRQGLVSIGLLNSYRHPDVVRQLQLQGVTSFAMELVPRITRAQAMDVLSSQATVVGYQGVLMAAELCNRFFPMLTTAAGTIRPAKVLILGAGVAGLQAIATARRLGAVVQAYDVRRAAREQVESLGAKFLQVELDAEAEGGYARALSEEEKQREQALLWRSVEEADVVISTAQIPGREAPRLISTSMAEAMKAGAVIIDLAAESGGNCELTVPGEQIEHQGVMIWGPLNVPSRLAIHASEMYAKNIYNFLGLLGREAEAPVFDWEDEILAGSVVTHGGEIKQPAIRELVEGQQS